MAALNPATIDLEELYKSYEIFEVYTSSDSSSTPLRISSSLSGSISPLRQDLSSSSSVSSSLSPPAPLHNKRSLSGLVQHNKRPKPYKEIVVGEKEDPNYTNNLTKAKEEFMKTSIQRRVRFVEEQVSVPMDKRQKELWGKVREKFLCPGDYDIKCAGEGSGGVYFLKLDGHSQPFAVFKPSFQEPGAQGNPNGFVNPKNTIKGLPAGDAYLREVAVYMMSAQIRDLTGIDLKLPTTVAVGVDGFGRGSLQKFVVGGLHLQPINWEVEHNPPQIDWDDGLLQGVKIEEKKLLLLLDFLICNRDRHRENLLFVFADLEILEPGKRLKLNVQPIPIDHGQTLPNILFPWRAPQWGRWWKRLRRVYGAGGATGEWDGQTKIVIENLHPKMFDDLILGLGLGDTVLLNLKIVVYVLRGSVQRGWTIRRTFELLERDFLEKRVRDLWEEKEREKEKEKEKEKEEKKNEKEEKEEEKKWTPQMLDEGGEGGEGKEIFPPWVVDVFAMEEARLKNQTKK